MNRQARRHPDRHPEAKSVVVGFAHPGHVDGLFQECLLRLLLRDHSHGGHILEHGGYVSLESGPRVSAARTQIVDLFLSTNAEWLWMLDADMTFDPDTLERLLDSADPVTAPIVGGLTFAGHYNTDIKPLIYVLNGDGAKMDRLNDYPRDQLCKVDATGAACLLVHRSVFEKMAEKFPRPYPWFAEAVIDGLEYGEDVTFCIRANRLQIPVHVHTGIHIGHVKRQVLNEPAYDEWRGKLRAEVEARRAEMEVAG